MVWYNPKIRLCSPTEHAEDHESGKDMPKWRVWFALLEMRTCSRLVNPGTSWNRNIRNQLQSENAGVISSVRTGVQLKTKMNMDDSKRQPQLLCALQLGSDSRKNHSAFCIFLCCRVSLILQFLLYSLDCSSVAFRF